MNTQVVNPGTWVAVVPTQSDVLLCRSSRARIYLCYTETLIAALLQEQTAQALVGVKAFPSLGAALEYEHQGPVLEVTATGEIVYQSGDAIKD